MTIVDPTATTHDGVTLTFVATTANAHTLSNAAGSGFFSSGGASKDVATFGGAIGDGLTIMAYQGKWYIDPRGSTNITLG
jgi:enoyl reductase-like protein